MATNHFLPDETGSTERPGLISVLGVLSFINCGLFMLIYGLSLLGIVAFQQMPLDEVITATHDALAQYDGMFSEEQMAEVDEILPIIHASGGLLLFLMLLRTVVRFVGALGIWRGRRRGYMTYAVAQVAGIFLPLIVLPARYLGFFGPVMAIVLCVLYGTQLKRLS